MKICIDSRSATLHEGSGIGTYTKNIVLNLTKKYNKNLNLICTGKYSSILSSNPNTNIYITSGKYNSFYENYYIPKLLIDENIDLYHIPQNGIGFPFLYDLNVVVTIHDLIPYIMPETVGKGYLERFLKDMPNIIDKSKGILTVSEYSKRDILRFFPNCPEDKIHVIPLAADTSFKPLDKEKCREYIRRNYKINNQFILYLGGFSSRKNIKNLILSFSKIKNTLKKKYTLVLGGALKDEAIELQSLVTDNGLQDSVVFTGYLNNSILPIFYNAAELFVYPSLYEGFGLPPLEAMSCKCPVITSNISSIPEVTKDSVLLINPYNIDELSSSIIKILNNKDLQEEYIEKGYNRSLEFSWTKATIETINAYKKVASSFCFKGN